MFDKLEAIEKTYDDLTEQMTDPGVIGDQTRYTKVAKQHRDLEPVVEKYRELRKLDSDISGAKEILRETADEEMRELADYYASRKPPRPKFQPDPEKAAIGKAKAAETLCTMCHLGGFAGQNEIPRVAGQNYDYIVKQLKDFKARRRANDGGSMTSVANTMSDEDIDNVAHYLAGL